MFATLNDWKSLLTEACALKSLALVRSGETKDDEAKRIVEHSHIGCGSYLLLYDNSAVTIRTVGAGGRKLIDQLENPDSVSLSVNGLTPSGNLLASSIGTSTQSEISAEIMRLLVKLMKRDFTHIKSFQVGPEALYMLQNNVRLMPTAKSPSSYDLRI